MKFFPLRSRRRKPLTSEQPTLCVGWVEAPRTAMGQLIVTEMPTVDDVARRPEEDRGAEFANGGWQAPYVCQRRLQER